MQAVAKPVIKWVGGKTQVLSAITQRLPYNIRELPAYAEPFLGGGSVLLHLLQNPNFNAGSIVINDINPSLTNLYRVMRDNAGELITLLAECSDAYLALADRPEDQQAMYYERRVQYNAILAERQLGKAAERTSIEDAALFIFLNKTCFNGLHRVNKRGLFNSPWNKNSNPSIFTQKNITACSRVLSDSNVTILTGGYEAALAHLPEGSFVYLDPPYRPLNATANFDRYAASGFNDDDQCALAQMCHNLHERGINFLLSNSDPKNTNPDDEFFDDLYAPFTIERIWASRRVNANGAGRGAIRELLIRNY